MKSMYFYLSKIEKGLYPFVIMYFMMFFLYTCAGQPPRVLTVQVVSRDGGQPLSGAVVTAQKDNKSRSSTTIQGGRTTIDPAPEPPFIIKVEYPYDNTYLPTQIEITGSDFGSGQIPMKEVFLEKKKTSIKGKLIDAVTRKPVPVVSVSIEPGISQLIDSDTSGVFLIQSSDFKDSIIYKINFKRERPYNDRAYTEFSKMLKEIILFETLDLGVIEMESIEIEKGDIIDETLKPKDPQQTPPTLGL